MKDFDSSGYVRSRPPVDVPALAEALKTSAEKHSQRMALERARATSAQIDAAFPQLRFKALVYFDNKVQAEARRRRENKHTRRAKRNADPKESEPKEQRLKGLPPPVFKDAEERQRWFEEMVKRRIEEEGARVSPQIWSRLLRNGLWSGFLEQMP